MAFEETKREVAVGNRVLHHIGLTDGITLALGHVNMRVPGEPDRFIVKGRGYAVDVLPVVRGEDMIVCDLDGAMVEGPPGGMPCFEVKIHSAIYKNYPEVNSVVHVHPRYTVLMSVLGVPLVPMCQEGANLVRTPVPMWSHTRLVVSNGCLCLPNFIAVSSITTKGAYTVEIHLSKLYSPILSAFITEAPNWTVDPTVSAQDGEAA